MSRYGIAYVTAEELSNELKISRTRSFDLVRRLNDELKSQGYIVFPGRISREYLKNRIFGYEAIKEK